MAERPRGMRRREFLNSAFGAAAALLSGTCNHGSDHRDGTPRIPAQPDVSVRETPLAIAAICGGPMAFSELDSVAILRRLMPSWRAFKVSRAVHALHLWGRRCDFPPAAFTRPYVDCHFSMAEIESLLLDRRAYAREFPSEPPLLGFTPHGVLPRLDSGESNPIAGGFAHPDELLAVLGQSGASLLTPLCADGGQATVAALLSHSLATFRIDQQIEWTLEAYLRYLRPGSVWRTIHGRRFTFDDLASLLLQQDLAGSACCGTHVVYSLVLLLRANEDQRFLSERRARQVREWAQRVRDELERTQLASGWCPGAWHPRLRGMRFSEEPIVMLTSTGHHLEWLAMAPVDLRVPRSSITRAFGACFEFAASLGDRHVCDLYLPLTHFGRGIGLHLDASPYNMVIGQTKKGRVDAAFRGFQVRA